MNRKGFQERPASRYLPAKASDPSKGDKSGNKNTEERFLGGDASDHDFNHKAKVTNGGGNFHEFGETKAGLKFNGAEKDASIAYLKDRLEKGQRIRNFSGGNEISRLHTGNAGVTAYNTMPIKEVYSPATSNKVPSESPVVRPTLKKEETQAPSNQSKLGKQVRDAGK